MRTRPDKATRERMARYCDDCGNTAAVLTSVSSGPMRGTRWVCLGCLAEARAAVKATHA